MNLSNQSFIGWTAIVGGAVGIISFIALLLQFVVGDPFSTLNDLLSIPVAFLMIPLVLALYRLNAPVQGALSLVAALAGVAGFFATAIGSGLLVFNRISFEQSLLSGIGGFGLIGLWLLINSMIGIWGHTLPRGAAWLGLLLAVTPTLALVAVLRAGDVGMALANLGGQTSGMAPVSPLIYAFVIMGFISYAGLPVWFILMGRLFLANRLGSHVEAFVAP
jgi:hypothetical protein